MDRIHLQKSRAGLKARFTADSDHEKASLPSTFHTYKEPLPLRAVYGVGMRDGGEKQTLAMECTCIPLSGSSSQRQNKPAYGCGDQLLTRYQRDAGDASINGSFLKELLAGA